MDALLARLGGQAVNIALRSGISITSALAVQQFSKLLKTVDDKALRGELKLLQGLLSSKVKVLSPAIELIELKSGRGNVFLEAAVPLVKALQKDIVALGQHLEETTAAEENSLLNHPKPSVAEKRHDLAIIIGEIKDLLTRIDREIPLIQLAITASGESLSNSLPSAISPSRLLQAAMFLNIGDGQFAGDPRRPVQIGPTFHVSVYMLFVSHVPGPADEHNRVSGLEVTPVRSGGNPPKRELQVVYGFEEGERRPTWKEVIHKCRVRLCRNPQDWVFDRALGYRPKAPAPHQSGNNCEPDLGVLEEQVRSYSYHLEMIEDFADGRVHDEIDGRSAAFDSIVAAGIRESMPVHQITKIFYADTGRLLNLGSEDGENRPVLLLKRDRESASPAIGQGLKQEDTRQSKGGDGFDIFEEQVEIDRQIREESAAPPETEAPVPKAWLLPQHLDPEWLAFEVFTEYDDMQTDSDDEVGEKHRLKLHARQPSIDPNLVSQIRKISLGSSPPPQHHSRPSSGDSVTTQTTLPSLVTPSPFGAVASSLSLMEMLIRLTSLQEFQQASHLSIPDHILTFFLEETSTTGLRGEKRWKARSEAKRKVGFDPYTDTPTK